MALSCQTYEVNLKYFVLHDLTRNSECSQVFEVYDSLPEPSLKAMDRIVSSAIDLCTLIYLGVGVAGYLAFADTPFTGSHIHLKH